MNKILFLPAVFLIIGTALKLPAQVTPSERFLEVGFGLAATNYSGDMTESHIEITQTNFGGNLFVRYQILPFILLRGQLFAGKVAGDDRHSSNHKDRSFRFSSFMLESTGLVELALGTYQYDPTFSTGSIYISPYVFSGAGALFIRPQVEYYGDPSRRDYFVQAPFPEGGKDRHILLITPFGGGIRTILSERLAIGMEANIRPTYSDMLDGVSLNGNPDSGDWYYSLGLTCSYILNGPFTVKRRGL
jgi:hypothetical protein